MDSTITLSLDENGMGATFPGGISVYGTTLNEILEEGAAYYKGDTMITPDDGVTTISGGDVVIKAYVAPVYSGWTEIDGNWYYYDPATNEPVTGVNRVPYPDEFGNYGPDDRDASHEEASIPESSHYYPDASSAFFYFDENGKFQSTLTGVITVDGELRYVKNGQLIWCAGLVQDGEDYYFFGGNWTVKKNSVVYLYRNDSNITWVPAANGVALAGADGKIILGNGIVSFNDTLYFLENNCLAQGKGLVKVGDNFYYVRSSGELVVSKNYWVSNVNEYTDISVGTYSFDANGVMNVNSIKNGVYEEDGGLFYYENGRRTYKGLIEIDGDYYYVRSNGQLATGKYWITKTNDIEGFAESNYYFGADGKMLNGVVDGFYYENGKLAYKGLMEYNGGYIYVRSNGQLATGKYWVTKTNDLAPVGSYEFKADGMMDIDGKLPELKNGVVDGCYYVDGILTYAGLMEYNGGYIYVRSNGQLATGKYWITKTNGLKDEGQYTFDENGMMITE